MSSATGQLLALERERCEAISNGDVERVASMLAEDLTHTHINGMTQDKKAYLAGLRGRPRTTTRGGDLRVRLFGDVAVMTGRLRNSFPSSQPGVPPVDHEIHALQVWVRSGDQWKQVAFASSGQAAG